VQERTQRNIIDGGVIDQSSCHNTAFEERLRFRSGVTIKGKRVTSCNTSRCRRRRGERLGGQSVVRGACLGRGRRDDPRTAKNGACKKNTTMIRLVQVLLSEGDALSARYRAVKRSIGGRSTRTTGTGADAACHIKQHTHSVINDSIAACVRASRSRTVLTGHARWTARVRRFSGTRTVATSLARKRRRQCY
jgi:hypothetical protein